jgi:hypothetical protein
LALAGRLERLSHDWFDELKRRVGDVTREKRVWRLIVRAGLGRQIGVTQDLLAPDAGQAERRSESRQKIGHFKGFEDL